MTGEEAKILTKTHDTESPKWSYRSYVSASLLLEAPNSFVFNVKRLKLFFSEHFSFMQPIEFDNFDFNRPNSLKGSRGILPQVRSTTD